MSRHLGRAGCRGFSMIEVLVSLLVIAIGVLGAAALQSRAVQSGMETYQRTQALLLVEDMVARIKGNKANISCYAAINTSGKKYVGTSATPPSGCNSLADADIQQWHDLLLGSAELSGTTNTGGIINARGCVRVNTAVNGEFIVSVAWQGTTKVGYVDSVKDSCAKGAYESDFYRRVVGVTVRITDLR